MKVYVVIEMDIDKTEILHGISSTSEKAETYKQELIKNRKWMEVFVDERDVDEPC